MVHTDEYAAHYCIGLDVSEATVSSMAGTRAVGCVFARLLAKKPDKYGQRFVSIPKFQTVDRTAKKIATTVGRLIDDTEVSDAILLFPDITKLKYLAEVMLELGKQPQWDVGTRKLDPLPAGEFIAFRVARDIPCSEEWWPSEALVFGDFPEFPATRRSPVTALEIFVGEPRRKGPWGKKDSPKQANLAHIELNLADHDDFKNMWERSITGRTASLDDPNDTRAKAKVAFVVSKDLASRLECVL